MLIKSSTDKTVIATLRPTKLLALFKAPQLESVAREVEETIMMIMNEAANGAGSR